MKKAKRNRAIYLVMEMVFILCALLFLLVFSSVGIQPAERRLHVGVLGVPHYLHQQPSSETVYFKN